MRSIGPVPASLKKPMRHRLDRGGDRAASSATYIIAIGRLRLNARSQAHVAKCIAAGSSKLEAIRCPKAALRATSSASSSGGIGISTRTRSPLDL